MFPFSNSNAGAAARQDSLYQAFMPSSTTTSTPVTCKSGGRSGMDHRLDRTQVSGRRRIMVILSGLTRASRSVML
jgi:hypothetical protein